MNIGTKSLLYGVHCVPIHTMLIAIAWWKLYGFPWDPRLWFSFLLHDIGYWGKPNMDGPEGELHPYLGASIMSRLFGDRWKMFTLLHSRYLAKQLGLAPSRLAMADKLVIVIEPSWLYLPRAILTGEIKEYFGMAILVEPKHEDPETYFALTDILRGGQRRDPRQWHRGVRAYMRIWVERHKDGSVDTMTRAGRGN